MGTLLAYSLTSGLVLLCLYPVFKGLLSGANQHGYNRSMALSIYALSFLLLPMAHTLQSRAAHGALPQDATLPLPALAVSTTQEAHALWPTVLIWIYAGGMAVVAACTLMAWARIIGIIRRGDRTRHEGFTLVLTRDRGVAPFSWLHFVVMSHDDYADCGDMIVAHECRHIYSLHWIDLLVAQAALTLQWFNPAAWLMRRELTLIHEYQADMGVIACGFDAAQYQMVLIRKTAGPRFPSLASSLNHSNLKKRITMMYRKKSSKGNRLGGLALVPATALALSLTAIPSVNAAISTIGSSELFAGKVTENPATAPETKPLSFQISFNNSGSESIVTVKGYNVAEANVTDIHFVGDGKEYVPRNVNTNIDSGTMTLDMHFEPLPDFGDATLNFDINGTHVSISTSQHSSGTSADTGSDSEPRAVGSFITMTSTTTRSTSGGSASGTPAVQTASSKSMLRINPEHNSVSVTTTENGKEVVSEIKLDPSKTEDGVAYIHNGKQITKAEYEALDQSSVIAVPAAQRDGLNVVFIMSRPALQGN